MPHSTALIDKHWSCLVPTIWKEPIRKIFATALLSHAEYVPKKGQGQVCFNCDFVWWDNPLGHGGFSCFKINDLHICMIWHYWIYVTGIQNCLLQIVCESDWWCELLRNYLRKSLYTEEYHLHSSTNFIVCVFLLANKVCSTVWVNISLENKSVASLILCVVQLLLFIYFLRHFTECVRNLLV